MCLLSPAVIAGILQIDYSACFSLGCSSNLQDLLLLALLYTHISWDVISEELHDSELFYVDRCQQAGTPVGAFELLPGTEIAGEAVQNSSEEVPYSVPCPLNSKVAVEMQATEQPTRSKEFLP
eukprot:IDg19263t1